MRVIVGLLLMLLWPAQAMASDAQIIVNADAQVESLSQAQLRRIFTMRQRQWPNGLLIKVFVLPNQNALHQHFSKSQLNMFPYQLERLWNKLVYSGLSERPVEVYDEQQMLQLVAQTPGAIGYISVTENTSGVGVIKLAISEEGDDE
ncbi:hypothetical protein [Bowmanella yangjiangensis]|uniref:PBP domain-containing protein n=2 Tax=Bowmanella yangjiangensis TaxID=2811230 RepID=A0ABS3CPT5_9ALTE|nr:hypothetical protein [Bowmanella yangjiangensis]